MLRRAVPGFRQLAGQKVRFTTAPVDANESLGPQASSPAAQDSAAEAKKSAVKNAYLETMHRYKALPNQRKVAGCRDLVDIRRMMELYREERDDPSRKDPVSASDVANAILETTRARAIVLRSVLSRLREQIILKQNKELVEYLLELVSDLESGRSFLSKYAITYLLTAFAAMNHRKEATAVWNRLLQLKGQPNIKDHMTDPRVVGAAIHTADPSTTTLEEIVTTYDETREKHGRHILLDEALAIGYLRFREWEKASDLYADMCSVYNLKSWQTTISRLHNRILTDSTNVDIGSAFLQLAIEPRSHVNQLHPSAAAKHLSHHYEERKDFNAVRDIYEQVLKYYNGSHNLPAKHYKILNSEVLKVFFTHYPEATEEAIKAADDLLDLTDANTSTRPLLFYNGLLSGASKTWPNTPYIVSLAYRLADLPDLWVDSYRVLLNSAGVSAEIDPEHVKDWWTRRNQLPAPIQPFDWSALVQASNFSDNVIVFKNAVSDAANSGELTAGALSKIVLYAQNKPFILDALVGLQEEGKIPQLADLQLPADFEETVIVQESETQIRHSGDQSEVSTEPQSEPQSELQSEVSTEPQGDSESGLQREESTAPGGDPIAAATLAEKA